MLNKDLGELKNNDVQCNNLNEKHTEEINNRITKTEQISKVEDRMMEIISM